MRKPAALTRALAREAAELFVGETRPRNLQDDICSEGEFRALLALVKGEYPLPKEPTITDGNLCAVIRVRELQNSAPIVPR